MNNDELRRKITRDDAMYVVAMCLAMAFAAAVSYVFINLMFLAS